MVVKNDPTLMFTNAGMNQFKDLFLGFTRPEYKRVANSQKCLRVSGKHNDLEEVGHDTYHHTMFEMLGNWSFGDYFKEEAIRWALEYLVEKLDIDINRLYATIFEGSPGEGLEKDTESYNIWKKVLSEDRVLEGSRKDNFWEMGETGPCGPCSEIHIDLRPEKERKKIPGKEFVNTGHPLVIEIWNLVFIQFNRLGDGKLEPLPMKHVDTGMGFERLAMITQGKTSNYDTDIFQPLLEEIGKLSGIKYGSNEKTDIATRVVADHLRAVAFSIADGQLPSNNKAGYVIRRILRRAIRYAYSFLGMNRAFMYRLVPALTSMMREPYPELFAQEDLISKVIHEEEDSFLKTLDAGIRILDHFITEAQKEGRTRLDGKSAFTLYDTYGFPVDLTKLILSEKGFEVDLKSFEKFMQEQKQRSKKAGKLTTGEWVEIVKTTETLFTGYDQTESDVRITKYRKVSEKGKEWVHLVFDTTPFYAESGGQVGDTGKIISPDGEVIPIVDTKKENNLIIHVAEQLPREPENRFHAVADPLTRKNTANNHTATHLLHKALRDILGPHVEQKGSLVHPRYLRFDFSHFKKPTQEELVAIEKQVNASIRANYHLEENRAIPYREALQSGAIALFGEKYEDKVRVVKFGKSVELCGGTHVQATGSIGLFKITSESSIAAGIRRIEGVTGSFAEDFIYEKEALIRNLQSLFKGSRDLEKSVTGLIHINEELRHKMKSFEKVKKQQLKSDLISQAEKAGEISLIIQQVEASSPSELKDIAFQLRRQVPGVFCALGSKIEGKAHLVIALSDELAKEPKIDAGQLIKQISGHIKGGGGGQPFLATAGGQNPDGIPAALNHVKKWILDYIQHGKPGLRINK